MNRTNSLGPSVQEAVDHFKQLPWCAALLEAPGVLPFLPACRLEDGGRSAGFGQASRDQLFQMLNTPDTIPCMLGLHADPEGETFPDTASGTPTTLLVRSTTLLCDLRKGINGFNGTVHGGLGATLVDEATVGLLFQNYACQKRLDKKHVPAPPGILRMDEDTLAVTAYMTQHFLALLPTPRVVAVTATLNRIEGRKVFLDVVLRDDKTEFVRCEGMWLVTKLSERARKTGRAGKTGKIEKTGKTETIERTKL